MHNYANHGYVVKAMELVRLLRTDEAQHEFREMIETGDEPDEIGKFFAKNMEGGYPIPSFFTLNDDCEANDMELNELYAMFDDSDLFYTVKTPMHIELRSIGIEPELKQWVTWG